MQNDKPKKIHRYGFLKNIYMMSQHFLKIVGGKTKMS